MVKINGFFKKLLLGIVFLVASILFSIFIICVLTFNQIKGKFAEKATFKTTTEKEGYALIEKDSLVNPTQLKQFLNFAEIFDEKSVYYREKFQALEKITDSYIEDMNLPILMTNDCSDYMCLQKRVPFSMIPPNLWKSLISIEDIRFLNHDGVDYIAIARALIADIKAMKIVQGGSTLTQQVVKNLFLSNEKTWTRKIKEAYYAIFIELFFEKEEILTVYLNEVFWGTFEGVKIKGVYAASLAYFDKIPEKLEIFETAILVSMLKGPNIYHPLRNHKKLFSRARFLMMNHLKIKKGKELWSQEKFTKWVDGLKQKLKTDFSLRSYMQMHINGDLTNSSGGKVSLNQFEKYALFNSFNNFSQAKRKQLKGKDVAFKVKVIPINKLGSATEGNSESKVEDFQFYSKLERKKETAIEKEVHQIGSLIKPFLYSLILLSGHKINEVVRADAISIKTTSGVWTPKDHAKVKQESLQEALQNSHNRPMLRMLEKIGFDNLERMLKQVFPNLLSPLKEYPAQLLGAIEISMSDLGVVYKRFFTDYCRFKHIKDVVFALADPTKTTIRRQINHNFGQTLIFGKTGTTNKGRDNWFMSFDGENLYLLWFGLESDPKKLGLPLAGSTSSFKIFQDFYQFRGKQFRDLDCELTGSQSENL